MAQKPNLATPPPQMARKMEDIITIIKTLKGSLSKIEEIETIVKSSNLKKIRYGDNDWYNGNKDSRNR